MIATKGRLRKKKFLKVSRHFKTVINGITVKFPEPQSTSNYFHNCLMSIFLLISTSGLDCLSEYFLIRIRYCNSAWRAYNNGEPLINGITGSGRQIRLQRNITIHLVLLRPPPPLDRFISIPGYIERVHLIPSDSLSRSYPMKSASRYHSRANVDLLSTVFAPVKFRAHVCLPVVSRNGRRRRGTSVRPRNSDGKKCQRPLF